MAVDRERARQLREQGLSYSAIALELRCSVDWCKRALVGVSKNVPEKAAIALAVERAVSGEGITNGELRGIVRTVYPYVVGSEHATLERKAVERFKAAIGKHRSAVIRPYWMKPTEARKSFRMVLSAVDILTRRIDEEVVNIRTELGLDDTYNNSVRYAVLKMIAGTGLAEEGVENHCRTLENIVIKLEGRKE